MCVRMYLFILYCALLSQKFDHLLLNNIHCYRYYNVSERPQTYHTTKIGPLRQSFLKIHSKLVKIA